MLACFVPELMLQLAPLTNALFHVPVASCTAGPKGAPSGLSYTAGHVGASSQPGRGAA